MPDSTHVLRQSFLILCVLVLLPELIFSQIEVKHVRQADTIETALDLFGETDPMHITLTLDLKKYQRDKFKGEYLPVHFLYEFNETLYLEKEMRIKARGEFRRGHCGLPPFWLDLPKSDIKDVEQQDFARIKIVSHCKGSSAYEEIVLKEYLCYKIYNIISPNSFRVRLVRMTYVDTGRKNRITEGWAFMIEPVEMLAQRFDAKEIKKEGLLSRNMRPVEMNMLALFQYMIGHTDYSVPLRHNVKILVLSGIGYAGYIAVPYDFDYSGLVDAHYALPAEFLNITSVRERYYVGPCRPEVDFVFAIEQLNSYREEILNLVWNFEYLDQKVKKSVVTYLEEYFDQAVHQKSLLFGFKRTCL